MSGASSDKSGKGQLRLSFPAPPLGFADLVVSPCNAGAFRVIRRPTNWPMPALCLLGERESGLTTAAKAWALDLPATYIRVEDFDRASHTQIEAWANDHTVVDGADRAKSLDNLLSLINLSERKRARVLLTANTPPKMWATRNPDLRSRLNAMPIAKIEAPDEEMLIARLVASCRRDFIRLSPEVIRFLGPRLGRSYAGIEDYVRRLTSAVLETGRAPTVPLARAVLEEGAGSRALFDDEE